MLRILAALGFLIALVAFASGTEAVSQKLWNTCKSDDADAAIKACTRILAGKESHKNQAIAFNNRGVAYRNKGDYDHRFDRHVPPNVKPSTAIIAFGPVGWAHQACSGRFDAARFRFHL